MAKRYVQIDPKLKPSGPKGSDILATERSKASFDVKDLQQYMYGNEFIRDLNDILKVVQEEPAFDKSQIHYMGRQEKVRYALRQGKRLFQLQNELKWTPEQAQMADLLLDLPGPYGLHKSMFFQTLRGQATEEQQKKYLEPALRYEIIGCYAQTELGHGSNVQGLETTATYIPEEEKFEIHSPYMTSSKWWIGGLGRTANHAIVMARLITKGKDYGIHPFIVQIRDMKTHQPLPNITIGDIGPKFGYQTTDNGFMLFDHIKIDRSQMLARYSQVAKDGTYTKPPNKALTYGTLTFIRANIVMNVRIVLARAVTVAVRYCAIRRQFADRDAPVFVDGKALETPVLDYSMVQYRLLPIISQAYACLFTGREMFRLYEENQKNLQGGNLSLLADVHASSSGLKSLTTTMAASAIEECRRATGGHGFSTFSGLTSLYQDYLPNVTWEGDNYMITQQVARYLFKTYRQVVKEGNKISGKDSNPTIGYLQNYLRDRDAVCPVKHVGDFHDKSIITTAFGQRAAHLIATTVEKRDRERKTWNSLLVDQYRISVAHCQFILVSNFAKALDNDQQLRSNAALHHIMTSLFQLFALHTMETEAAEFLSSGYVTPKQHLLLRNRVMDLLSLIRPQAVSLVDAFGIPDYLLNSALGRYDGAAYESLFEGAMREPLNGDVFDVNPWSDVMVRGEKPVKTNVPLKGKL